MASLSIEFKVPNVPLFDDRGPKVIDEELRAAVGAGAQLLKGEIIPLMPVGATGLFRQGVQVSVTGEGVTVTGRVFDAVSYAAAADLGTRPHWPPRAPIELWVRRKLGISDERQAKSVAFLICRAISRRGTKGAGSFRAGFDAGKDRVMHLFERANARIVARLTGGQP
jgi:hypothetical protein